jgi:small-conductance mechanosensitive channel/CRP-like cAMP-binding protein
MALLSLMQQESRADVIGVIVSLAPYAVGWILWIVLALAARFKPHYRMFRLPLFLLLFGATFLKFTESPDLERVRPLGLFILGFAVAYLIARLLVFISFNMVIDRRRGTQTPALMKTVAFFALLMLILLVLNEYLPEGMRFDPTSILASAAVISVVLGFALQDTLGNLFSGLALHLENPLKVGQWVRIDQTIGEVVEMDWRSVKLRTLSHDYHIIPNSAVASRLIVNYSDPPRPHRRSINIRAPWSASPDQVRAAVLPILENHRDVVDNPAPAVLVNDFQDHWITYEVRYWYTDYSRLELLDAEVRRQVWYHFRRDRIETPFPRREVFLHEVSEEPRGAKDRLQELRGWLRNLPLFEPLSEEEFDGVVTGMNYALFAAGENIIRQGEEGNSFYVIFRGEAEVRVREGGGSKVVKLLHRGDYFGEMALLTGERRTATITAITESACYILDSAIFSSVLKANPQIAERLSETLVRRQTELETSRSDLEKELQTADTHRQKRSLLSKIRNYFGLT